MSIEKYKPEYCAGVLKHEPKPYTQILNKVLQECNNLEALALWCHLQSRPENWIISPKNIQNHFNIGKDKTYNLFTYLIESNLLRRDRIVKHNGTYGKTEYIVLSGENFVKIQDHINEDHPLPENKEMVSNSPLPDLPDTVNPPTTNKRFIKIKDTNKNISPKKKKPRAKIRKQIDESFVPNEHHLQLADDYKLDINDQKNRFIDYYLSVGKVMLSWNAAFNNWLRKAHDFNKTKQSSGFKGYQPVPTHAKVDNQSTSYRRETKPLKLAACPEHLKTW